MCAGSHRRRLHRRFGRATCGPTLHLAHRFVIETSDDRIDPLTASLASHSSPSHLLRHQRPEDRRQGRELNHLQQSPPVLVLVLVLAQASRIISRAALWSARASPRRYVHARESHRILSARNKSAATAPSRSTHRAQRHSSQATITGGVCNKRPKKQCRNSGRGTRRRPRCWWWNGFGRAQGG